MPAHPTRATDPPAPPIAARTRLIACDTTTTATAASGSAAKGNARNKAVSFPEPRSTRADRFEGKNRAKAHADGAAAVSRDSEAEGAGLSFERFRQIIASDGPTGPVE